MDKYRNNQLLRGVMDEYELKHKDIVTLLSSGYGSISQRSVEAWVYDRSPMSGPMIELLYFKIKDALARQQSG